ncbi:MAG: peptide chain release factor N(5)-glutamine methyltransferase, partial [Verrucomicrobiae bacterium]|nr:peptide chain release factor N(5)-glutamine methyltransferase [Verrucomicrobiae bacterium]
GGEAGLDDLISIIDGCTDHLVDGGMIALETGIKQHQALMERAQSQGLKHLQSIKDLDRRDRFLIGSR